jgi:serine/threonine-protein kinase
MRRFKQEATAAASLNHPNIAHIYEVGEANGLHFIAMEYVDGTTLRNKIHNEDEDLSKLLRVLQHVAEGLAKAHDAGIIHRDLKPDNVMLVTRNDDPDFVKVLDFGIARIEPHTVKDPRALVTKMGTILGTPEYMSPEQAMGETAGPEADIYSVGVMLYEMLSGDIPFDAEDRGQILNKHILEKPPPMKGEHPPAIEMLVQRLLAKQPKDRPQNALELRREIEIAAARSGIDLAFTQSSPALNRLSEPNTDPSAPPEMTNREDRQWHVNDSLAKTEYGLKSDPDLVREAKTQFGAEKARGLGIPGVHLGPIEQLPRAAAYAAIGIPFFIFAFVIVVVISLAAHHGAESADGDGGAGGVATTGSAKVRTEHASAAQLVQAKATGATALEALAKEFPNDAAVQVELAKAYAKDGRTLDMLHVVMKLEQAAIDDDVLDLVVAAAQKPDTADEAFGILESSLGARGVDGLIDLSQQKPPARQRAQKALAKPEIRGRASAAASIFLDFKAARDCKAKHELLGRVKDNGDTRLLAVLKPMKKETGCGFLGNKDCWSCMRKDDDLDDAVRAIEGRTSRPSPKSSP